MNPSEKIDQQIAAAPGWRGEILTKLREIINNADPNMKEEWKWNTAVWTNQGMVCAISAFKEHVKINFFKGSQLKDLKKLINNGFDSKDHRSIDFREGDKIDEAGLTELVKEAIDLNSK